MDENSRVMCLEMSQMNESPARERKVEDIAPDQSPINPKLSRAIEEMKTKINNAPPKPPLIGKLAATAQSQIRIIKLASKQQQLALNQKTLTNGKAGQTSTTPNLKNLQMPQKLSMFQNFAKSDSPQSAGQKTKKKLINFKQASAGSGDSNGEKVKTLKLQRPVRESSSLTNQAVNIKKIQVDTHVKKFKTDSLSPATESTNACTQSRKTNENHK